MLAPLASDEYLERYLSAYGIGTWTDHAYDEQAVLDDCKNYASGLMAARLSQRYDYALLVNVPMLAELYAIITLRELTLRRGNPPPASLEMRYQEIMQKDGLLDQIASGKYQLTDENGNAIATRTANIPRWSNLQVDRRFSERQVRVVTGSSDMTPSKLPRDLDQQVEANPAWL